MEVSGNIRHWNRCPVSPPLLFLWASSIDAGARFSGELRVPGHRAPRALSGFCDDGHLQNYSPVTVRCVSGVVEKEKVKAEKKLKKRLKLLKGLEKNISLFAGMGFGLDPHNRLADQVKGQMISEAVDVLLGQLQQLKAEKKEMKRQRKEQKAKSKAARMQNRLESKGNSSSSSSEPSDSDCGNVVNMRLLKTKAFSHSSPNRSRPVIQESTIAIPRTLERGSISNTLAEERGISGKIEVCMGGKCEKSGAALLMEEFEKVVGVEGSVVGCKCMGKCRNGPNVKVLNSIDGIQDEVADDSVRTPANSLCIGVGLEDVGNIVANFFGTNQQDLGLAAAS